MPEGNDGLTRRDFLTLASSAVGVSGLGLAAYPFIRAMSPSSDIVAGGVLPVDVGGMKEGDLQVVLWRRQPVFILRRTREMIDKAGRINPASLRDPAGPSDRVWNPAWLVCFGICTHLGCVPLFEPVAVPGIDQPGFYCPCHGGKYDSLGRRLEGPPPENLHLLPYSLDGTKLLLGTKTFAGFSENVRKIGSLPKA